MFKSVTGAKKKEPVSMPSVGEADDGADPATPQEQFSGWLYKKGEDRTNWKKRWVVVRWHLCVLMSLALCFCQVVRTVGPAATLPGRA